MRIKEKDATLKKKRHASLIDRIAMEFAILFLVTGLFLVLVFMRIRTGSIAGEYENRAEDLIYEMEKGTAGEEQLEDACAFLRVVSKENRETVYLVGEEPGKLALGKWYFIKEKGDLQVYVRQKLPILLYGSECSAEFAFECTREWNEMRRELVFFFLWYLGVAAVAVFVCYVLVRAVLRPIDEMSRQVSRLNLQNLHKERLNEEGSKAELKELAEGINGMLDRMEQAYDAQKQFVSEASHELRTPITVLQGYSSMLKRWGAEDQEVLAESIDAIESEAKSMQDLVEKLLFLSRHERRKLPFAKERFDMAEVIDELRKEMGYMTSARIMQCPVCEPVRVYGDKQALKQAIRVFLDNAVKYTEEGDTITLSCRNKNGACEISIEDTGLGMKREDLEGIFGRFFRADTVRGKNIEGHGLGLSIARLIIDGHAGKITVRTQYTKGSCFTVTIPRQRGA